VRDFALMHSQPGKQRRYVELGRWRLCARAQADERAN